jgi:glycosyltransferase involved in cell wall biosynthesis
MILDRLPECHVVIAGEDRICYGSQRTDGKTWKQAMLEKVHLPADRVHFVGSLPYGQYRQLLRHSTVHVYLTRPFVLSWSLLEALSCGCALVASSTEPVREVIRDGWNGCLADIHSPADIA